MTCGFPPPEGRLNHYNELGCLSATQKHLAAITEAADQLYEAAVNHDPDALWAAAVVYDVVRH